VTVTWPDGHQEVFDFTPTGPQMTLIDFEGATVAFSARPGTNTTSTLQDAFGAVGLVPSGTGDLNDSTGQPYNPTQFVLTTRNGERLNLSTTKGLLSETDRNGNSLTVDTSGIHSSNGQSIPFQRDGSGRVVQITGPSGQVLKYGYAGSDLSTSTDLDGNTTKYFYAGNHNLVQTSGSGPRPFQILTYDSSGRLSSVTDADGNVTTITSNIPGQTQTVADPNGLLTTVFTYDALGDVISRQEAFSGNTRVQTATYDATGGLTSLTDPTGATSAFAYDQRGDVIDQTDPLGRTIQTSYSSTGEPLTVIGPNGLIDAQYTYTATGSPLTVADGAGNTTHYAYDSAGHLISVTDATGAKASFGVDPTTGRAISVTNPDGYTTQFAYDTSGHLTSATNPTGAVTRFAYDPAGQLLTITDPLGHARKFTYDASGNTATSTDALGRITAVSYDNAGNLISVTDPDGHILTYTYDVDQRLSSSTASDGSKTTITRDPLGEPTRVTNQTGSIILSYDAAGRLTSQQTDKPIAATTTYTYDAAGNRLSMNGPSGLVKYAWDSLNHLVSIVDPMRTFTIGRDSAGRQISITSSSGLSTVSTLDGDGRLLSATSSFNGTTLSSFSANYDPAGRMLSFTRNGTTATNTFDADGRLTSTAYAPATFPNETYSYDQVGNIIGSSVAPGTWTYNAANELTSNPAGTFTYDGEGARTSFTGAATSATTTYSWNALHQLIGIATPGSGATFSYDAVGRRVSTSSPSGSKQFAYDGGRTTAEYSSGTSTAQFTGTAGPLVNPLDIRTNSGALDVLATNNGSISALVSSNGSIVQSQVYSNYGTPQLPLVAPSTNPFGYLGQPQDPTTGLVYDAARYYDPATAQFLSRDPAPNVNSYAYAGGDPLDYADVSGTDLIPMAFLYQLDQKLGNAINRCLSSIWYTALTELLTAGIIAKFKGSSIPGSDTVASAVVGACVGGALFPDRTVQASIRELWRVPGQNPVVGAAALGVLGGMLAGALGATAASVVCGAGPDPGAAGAAVILGFGGGVAGSMATAFDAVQAARSGLLLGIAIGAGAVNGFVDASNPPISCPNLGG
jgi:RHS repeat-associated protein